MRLLILEELFYMMILMQVEQFFTSESKSDKFGILSTNFQAYFKVYGEDESSTDAISFHAHVSLKHVIVCYFQSKYDISVLCYCVGTCCSSFISLVCSFC